MSKAEREDWKRFKRERKVPGTSAYRSQKYHEAHDAINDLSYDLKRRQRRR